MSEFACFGRRRNRSYEQRLEFVFKRVKLTCEEVGYDCSCEGSGLDRIFFTRFFAGLLCFILYFKC